MRNLKKISFLLPLLLSFLLPSCGKDKEDETSIVTESDVVSEPVNPGSHIVKNIRVRNLGDLATVFNDSNYMQIEAAQRLGIEPIADLKSAYFIKQPIVKITDNEFYHVDDLKHSLPFLVPQAANLLADIGKNFIDSLHSRGGDNYKIQVTSLLRTQESVGKLKQVNINATDSSTHLYATTFDLSYVNFHALDKNYEINQGDLKNLLAEVLQDLRKEGRCLVKFERKTGCFHITVAK